VSGEYYWPQKEDKHQLAILLHGSGKRSVIPLQFLAKSLAKRGVACFINYLPIHPNRMSEESRKRYPRLSHEEWFEIYQTSVIEVRQIVDWASTREEIDSERIAAIGLSFGGFISAITMGVDERIGAGVFIVMGGNTEKIHYRGMLSSFTKFYKNTKERFQQIQKSYLKYLDEIDKKGFQNIEPPRQSFLTDPMTFAHCLRQRPVLMINARWDEMIPREAVIDFWKQSGKPPLFFYPTTHSTLWFWYPSILRRITYFVDSVFPI
jgi:esterase/lipase